MVVGGLEGVCVEVVVVVVLVLGYVETLIEHAELVVLGGEEIHVDERAKFRPKIREASWFSFSGKGSSAFC